MGKIMAFTAWKMEPIKAYGVEHLSFFIIGIICSLLIAFSLRKIEIKKLNKIIFGIGVFLFITELYKQLFYTYYIGNGSYQWWIFPFQLCSVPMYICLILPFVKKEKVYKTLVTFLISYNLLGGIISFIEPSGLIHEYITLTAHAFLWHMSLFLIGLIIGLNKNIKFMIKDFKYSVILYCIFCVIAFGINLMFWNISKGNINMFFIGPRISPIIVFKTIATKLGWYINTPIYMAVLTLGAFITYIPFTLIRKNT